MNCVMTKSAHHKAMVGLLYQNVVIAEVSTKPYSPLWQFQIRNFSKKSRDQL